MRSNFYIVGAVFVVIVLVVYFGLFHNSAPLDAGDATPPVGEFARTVGDVATWESYDGNSFAFAYPSQMSLQELTEDKSAVVVSYQGPTQTEGTEFFDGIAMSLAEMELTAGMSLQDLAEVESDNAKENGEILQPVTAIKLGGVDGYTYEFVGLGRFKSYFLPINDEKYLMITIFVADPKTQGFEEVKDKILDSLEII